MSGITLATRPSEFKPHLDEVFDREETVHEKAKRLAKLIIPQITQVFNIHANENQVRYVDYIAHDIKKVESTPKTSISLDLQASTTTSKKVHKTLEEEIDDLQEAYQKETNVEKRNHLVFKLFLLISREFDRIAHDEKQSRYGYFKEHFQRIEDSAKDPVQHGITILGGIVGIVGGLLGIGQGPTIRAISQAMSSGASAIGNFASLPGSLNQFDSKLSDHLLQEDKNVRDSNQGAQGQIKSQIIDLIRHIRQIEEANANARQAAIGN